MALTFNTTPVLNSPVKDILPFDIDVGASAANTKTILSYVVTGAGGATDIILPEQSIDDCGGQNIDLNFSQHIENRVFTTMPALNTAAVTGDTNFQDIFTVNFTETEFNTVSCLDTTLTNISQGSYNVYNIAPQWYESNFFVGTDPIVLSAKPTTLYLERGVNDWIWVRTQALGVDANFSVIGTGVNTVALAANTTYRLPVGPGNFIGAIAATTQRLQVTITPSGGGAAIYTYNIVLEEDCTGADGYEIYWVEPLGGYAGLRFENQQISGNRVASTVLADRSTSTDIATRGNSGGLTSINSQSFGRYTLSKELYYTEGIKRYLDGFIASEHHYINREIDGTNYMQKFILDNADYVIDNDEGIVILTISGREHENVNVLRNS